MSRAPIFVYFDGASLRPRDAYAAEQLAGLEKGAEFNARLSRITRAGREEREGQRGLWWAGCTLLSENVEHKGWDTARKAHEEILKGLGFVRPRFRIDGSFDMVPVSTSDSEMDDSEFAILQEKARAYCVDRFGFDPFFEWQEQASAREPSRKGKP